MTHDDRLAGAHEVGVAGRCRRVGHVVAVVAGVQVGAADPAGEDLEHDLPLAGHGVGQVAHVEGTALADQGPHEAVPGPVVRIWS